MAEEENWDTRERIVQRRASLMARILVGDSGLGGSLTLPRRQYGSSVRRLFTRHEREIAEGAANGLLLTTYDERGHCFKLRFVRTVGSYFVRGYIPQPGVEDNNEDQGWSQLAFQNGFTEDTIISLWVYRSPCALGPIMMLPSLLVLRENNPDPVPRNRLPYRPQLPCFMCHRLSIRRLV